MLITGKNHREKTHYEILSVKEDASYEEIRASYRSALLTSHPDKLQEKYEILKLGEELRSNFLKIREAWEILGDSSSRAIYDKELRGSRECLVVADDVKLEEMDNEEFEGFSELFYHCRCGDYFSINSAELAEMGFSLEGGKGSERSNVGPVSVVLPCCSCSLKIRLILREK